jgi:hypothetical protein
MVAPIGATISVLIGIFLVKTFTPTGAHDVKKSATFALRRTPGGLR